MEWIPDQEPGAVLQFAHGMIEHVERYREFAEFLARRGIAVYGHDHLGPFREKRISVTLETAEVQNA